MSKEAIKKKNEMNKKNEMKFWFLKTIVTFGAVSKPPRYNI